MEVSKILRKIRLMTLWLVENFIMFPSQWLADKIDPVDYVKLGCYDYQSENWDYDDMVDRSFYLDNDYLQSWQELKEDEFA